nr:cytochrome P450 [Staphylococcus massiliensis]
MKNGGIKVAKKLPKVKGLDNTVDIIKGGYTYVPGKLEEFDSKAFEVRALGGKKIAVMSGKEAAEIFYDNEKMERQGTLPKRIVNTLFGKGAIHTTAGKKHVDRKALFMSLMTDENLNYLRELTRNYWFMNTERMQSMDKVNVYNESIYMLTKIGFRWAGIIQTPEEAEQNAKDMDTMINSFVSLGSAYKGYKKAKKARKRVEDFLEKQIIDVRKGKLHPEEGTALYEFAHWEDLNDNPMDSHLCAVDLMNVVRPLAAINRFISYGVKVLIEFDQEKEKLRLENNEDYAYKFAQEVRRIFPFVPYLPGRAAVDLEYDGYKIPAGMMTALDVYGTTHDEDLWENPDQFNPNRFDNWDGSPFDLIPQGGGDFYTNHRCAGEWITVIIMEETMKYFANKIEFDVPSQDLSVKLDKLPGNVTSGTIISNVRPRVARK